MRGPCPGSEDPAPARPALQQFLANPARAGAARPPPPLPPPSPPSFPSCSLPPRRSPPRVVLISVTSRRGRRAPKGEGGQPPSSQQRELLKAARALNASRVSGIECWSYLNCIFFVWRLLLWVKSQGALRVITLPCYKILV